MPSPNFAFLTRSLTVLILATVVQVRSSLAQIQIGTFYVGNDGLSVRVNSLAVSETSATYRYSLSYTLENRTSDKAIDEGSFKAYFRNTTGGTPQYGSFGRLFPGNTLTRSYQWEELKSGPFGIIAYHSSQFFSDTPPTGALQWLVTIPGLPDLPAPTISAQPISQAVAVGGTASLYVTASGAGAFSYQWKKNGVDINGATNANLTLSNVQSSDAGSYTVVVIGITGRVTSAVATITVSSVVAPLITTQPTSQSVASGANASFTVVVSGTSPFTYQWRKDGANITGASNATLALTNVQSNDAGSYAVIITNAVGSVTSGAASLAVVVPSKPRLSNLAIRTTLAANEIVIVGFTMSGGSKNVLLRAAGPGLGALGVPGTMADPGLALYNSSTQVALNDNWQGNAAVSAAISAVGAFAFPSASSLDAALVANVEGGRTVQVSGPTAGNVIVEAYDAGTGDNPRFTNLAARNKVGTGVNILIAGFTLSGTGTRNLLIRAVGPKLADFGISGLLSDPKLELYNSSGTKFSENDNWASSLTTTFTSVGAFALNPGSKDAAITVSLSAGGYTVQVYGADGGSGEALIELYELP